MRTAATTIDEYIAGCSPDVQERLQAIRRTVARAAPGATEKISYAMPAFALRKNLVHFAAFQHHIGFFPGAEPLEVFADALAPYKTSKGGIQFPNDRRVPLALITKIVKFRVKQQSAGAGTKRK